MREGDLIGEQILMPAQVHRLLDRADIRQLLDWILLTGTDLDAFCLDYFPDVSNRFSGSGMDRVAKVNLLLSFHEPTEILNALQRKNPKQVARHLVQLRQSLDSSAEINQAKSNLEGRSIDQITLKPERIQEGKTSEPQLHPFMDEHVRTQQATDEKVAIEPPASHRLRNLVIAGAAVVTLTVSLALGLPPFLSSRHGEPVSIHGPTVPPVADARWQSMRAVHYIHIDEAQTPSGRRVLSLQGLIAIQRPDRYRYQVLKPGIGLLFDILKIGNDIKIIESRLTRDDGNFLRKALESLGPDLGAAYDLEPRSNSLRRTLDLKDGELRLEEIGRSIATREFKDVQKMQIPTNIIINNELLNYRVSIHVETVTLDEPLDSALFRVPEKSTAN